MRNEVAWRANALWKISLWAKAWTLSEAMMTFGMPSMRIVFPSGCP
jgi:hypothetical protein